jgi:hypothetical protein
MPQDPQRRQKALLKKRRKQKAAAKAHSVQQGQSTASLQAIIRNACSYPLLECLISPDWDKENSGLVQVLVARSQPNGEICFGLYLIDTYCLGLKNTLAKVNVSRRVYQDEALPELFHGQKPQKYSPELAHQMIYASIDYAAQFGFEPQQDLALTQHFLIPRGELEEPYSLHFGKDGKPFYIAGPHDHTGRILRQLEKTAGPGNYHFLMPADLF